jgi:hypothetical protein
MKPFTQHIRPEDVGELIDLTVISDPETQSMANLQLEGIAALYNILCKHRFAYLADEVGMGKTYQAMGLAALVWNEKPEARILFISPRQNLQVKWYDDYLRFFASNYRRRQGLGDDRAASVLFGQPVHRPVLFDNLRSWTPTIGMSERIAPFLRHTSFTRPVYLKSSDLGNINDLWDRTNQRLRSWGLFHGRHPRGLSVNDASEKLNLAFAAALNEKLTEEAGKQSYFDLVVVDEAQCLRNPTNQTNQVLFTSLKGHVNKWLFMSATPAHSGPQDIPRILNHYPDDGQVIDPELTKDLPSMQRELQEFLVRRQRQYRTRSTPKPIGKDKYRKHDHKGWGVRDKEMGALGTLAMGVVQKGLVDVLQSRSNRYRIGFLSSFESLQSSLARTLPPPTSNNGSQEVQKASDWHHDQADGVNELEAPDTNLIHRLASNFKECFGMPLPHPKVDFVVDRVAPLAFGTDTEIGGQKFLIFTRRVSTVNTLQDRLIRQYHKTIENRMRRCWGVELDWSGKSVRVEESDDNEDPEAFDTEPGENPFREAMSNKGWLFRYRQTFRATGRNSLFFEDGWLQRLCLAGGVNPTEAAIAIPDELWAESWSHASHSAGDRRQQYKASRVRYLAVQAIRRFPEVFGFNADTAEPWRTAYEAALHEHIHRAEPAADPHRAHELFTQQTLWTVWDNRFNNSPMALPAAKVNGYDKGDDLRHELNRRQVARTIIGQVFRLTDTVLDLYFADNQTAHDAHAFPKRFLDWLSSDDPSANQVRQDCTQWIAHLRLIIDSCLDGAGRSWSELAREETWPQLFNPMAVIGVTGGSGGHRTAIRQFRTPSLPRVIVCTDTLKEGVDLHLFCDRVLHYGVAWTSGDQEQRVGRIDRYFSQIERRLYTEGEPPDVDLHVGYPHIVASLERGQVECVIKRQKEAELLMDSPLASARHDGKYIVNGANIPRYQGQKLEPYQPNHVSVKRRPVVEVSEEEARSNADHYTYWYKRLTEILEMHDWSISPKDLTPLRMATLYRSSPQIIHKSQHSIEWSFDAALGRYVLTISDVPWENDAMFSGGLRRRLIGRSRKVESFIRLLVPTPEDGVDGMSIERLVTALNGEPPRVDTNAATLWERPLASLANGSVKWLSDHKAQAVVPRGDRTQGITLYAYDGGVRIISVIAPLDELEDRAEWGGSPTASHVRDWALGTTNDLAIGYLDVHERDGLVFGNHILHGELSEYARQRLVEEVAWRADAWEAALTGADRR